MCRSKANGGRRCGAPPVQRGPQASPATDVQTPDALIQPGSTLAGIPLRTRLTQRYSPRRFKPVRNVESNEGTTEKPYGGIWVSPLVSRDDLPDESPAMSHWDYLNDDGSSRPGVEHDVAINPGARVVVIDSWADYEAVANRWPRTVLTWQGAAHGIDYDALKAEADAIWLTPRGCQDVRSSTNRTATGYQGIYGWDIPSLVLLNKTAATITPR